MIAGVALASQAIGDGGRRQLAIEWGGPDPGAAHGAERALRPGRQPGRRSVVRKP